MCYSIYGIKVDSCGNKLHQKLNDSFSKITNREPNQIMITHINDMLTLYMYMI